MMPKLYVALSILKRREWSEGTACSSCVSTLELFLRALLRGENGDMLGAHIALYFENATPEMIARNWPMERTRFDGDKSSFFVDIFNARPHTVSYKNDPVSWYRKWSWIRVELYEVVGVSSEQIYAAHQTVLQMVAYNRPYDCCININSLVPSFGCYCGGACACFQCWQWKRGYICVCDGVNCVSSVLVGLAAARGADEWHAEQALGLQRRPVLGAWLPRELMNALVDAGVVNEEPIVLNFDRTSTTDAFLPHLLLINRV